MMAKVSDVMIAIWRRMKKRKHVDLGDTNTHLLRILSRRRLTCLGLANTVGIGIYVLIGVATKEYAGPSVILSFLIASVVTMLNAFCFAEYASRNPKTGAQYTFIYQAVGEAVAFNVGWTGIIGTASSFCVSCRGWSGYLDSLFGHAIQNFTVTHIANWSSHGQPFTEYPDIPAIFLVIVVMVITSIGVNFSSFLNSVLAAISCLILIFVTILGFFYADFNNWFNNDGGFFPYGFSGVLKASSACFYAFGGYDIIAMSSEEAIDSVKAVPQSIALTLILVTLLYLGVSISFTLMVPYKAVNTLAPLPAAFAYHSVTWAKYVVAAGTIITLTNLCTLSLYGSQRLMYVMSSDGLLFQCFSKVNERTKVPTRPVLAIGPVAILLILSIDFSSLISFMVIYVFIQNSFFAAYMIVLRYEHVETSDELTQEICDSRTMDISDVSSEVHLESNDLHGDTSELSKESVFEEMEIDDSPHGQGRLLSDIKIQCVSRLLKYLTERFSVKSAVLVVCAACFLLALQLVKGTEDVVSRNRLAIFSVVVLILVIAVSSLLIWSRDQKGERKGYLVPLMPFLPVTTLFCNMLMLVSVAEAGILIAALILPAVGMGVYLCMVTYGVLTTDNQSSKGYDRLKMPDSVSEEGNSKDNEV